MDVAVDDRTLRLSRVFDAPRQRVFAAWTDPDQFAQWFGPPGVTTVYCDLDVRVGGAWRLLGASAEGKHAVSGKYLEVKAPERLAFTWAWHEEGDHARPRGHETVVTLDFKDVGGKTEMTMVQGRFAESSGAVNHDRGWTGSFTKLETFLGRGA